VYNHHESMNINMVGPNRNKKKPAKLTFLTATWEIPSCATWYQLFSKWNVVGFSWDLPVLDPVAMHSDPST